MSILKWQVNFYSDFSSFFSAITYNSSVVHVVCSSWIFYLEQKDPMKISIFWHFQVFWWKFAKFLMSFSKPQVSFSSNFAWLFSVMKYTPLYFFRSNVVYFAQKGLIKVQIFYFLLLRSNFTKFLLILKQKISFPSNFAPLS